MSRKITMMMPTTMMAAMTITMVTMMVGRKGV
jgi:hypothetical protein